MSVLAHMSHPSENYRPATKSDTVNFPEGRSRAIFIGTAGNLSVVRGDGVTVVLLGVSGLLPISAVRINTATTADNLSVYF